MVYRDSLVPFPARNCYGTAVRAISYLFVSSHRDAFCYRLFCDHRQDFISGKWANVITSSLLYSFPFCNSLFVTQTRGHTAGASPPPPPPDYVWCVPSFFRGKSRACFCPRRLAPNCAYTLRLVWVRFRSLLEQFLLGTITSISLP